MRRGRGRPVPPRKPLRSTVSKKTGHSTVPSHAAARKAPLSPRIRRPRLAQHSAPPAAAGGAPKRHAARIIDPDDSTLLDVIDNLLSKGVVLNADVILALANVDLVYLRLSALLCAADRVLPPAAR